MRTQGNLNNRNRKAVMKPSKLAPGFFDVNACITVCIECADACTTCADVCLNEAKVRRLATCIWSDIDCADICHTTARLLARQADISPHLLQAQLQTTIAATTICAEECDKQAHNACCQHCAEVCRRCEKICRQLLANMPDEGEFSVYGAA